MTLDAGQVVLLPFPHTDLQAGKKRPALVLTSAQYNRDARDVVLAYVTSRPQGGKWAIAISDQDLAKGRLAKDSWIRVDRLTTVEQSLVQGVVGQLNAAVLRQVRDGLVALLG